MPIAIDASSPAGATGGGTITTAAFNPPANSLLVAVVAASASTPTISNSVTARTWTLQKVHTNASYKGIAIYTAPNPTALTGTQVTVGSATGGVKVYVITGAHPTSPIGTTGVGTTATNNATIDAYTSTAAGSRAFCAAVNWNGAAAPTSTDDETAWFASGFLSGMAVTKAANTATSGTLVQFNLDADGTGAADWNWVALEILGAALDATVNAAVVDAAGAVPAPSIQAGQTASPGTVSAAGEVPAPSIHAGQTTQPTLVDGQASVPSPNVIAGSAELVEPAVVEAAGAVPTPSISAIQNATIGPSAVVAAGSVPVATVSASIKAEPVPVDAQGVVPSPGVQVPILPGDSITADGQVEWGGTALWGAGTSYALREITGWDAKPKVDSLTEEEPNRHGAYGGKSLLQRRIVTVKLQVQSFADPSQVSGLLAQLRYDTRTLRDNTFLTLVIRGYTETLLAYAKVIDRTGVMDADWSGGYPEPVITFECPDPRRYSLDQHSAVIPANASSPTAVVNDGDLYTSPIFRISGPATNPMLVNETLDRVMAFDITLTSGQLLVVDTQRGKAEIGGVDHENDLADTISVPIKEFFSEVGSNDFSYETDSGGDNGVEVLWRDAYE